MLLLLAVLVLPCHAQRITRAEYIATWKEVAQENMREYGIPASITLAQACLESADGNLSLIHI